MLRAGARGLAIVAILFLAILPGASQGRALTILSASPDGDLTELADAGQIRIVFSEPMVPLGTVLSGAAPPWIRITPAVAGSFFWSGTKTLIFSPDGSHAVAVRHALHGARRRIGGERGRPFARRSVRAHVHDSNRSSCSRLIGTGRTDASTARPSSRCGSTSRSGRRMPRRTRTPRSFRTDGTHRQ